MGRSRRDERGAPRERTAEERERARREREARRAGAGESPAQPAARAGRHDDDSSDRERHHEPARQARAPRGAPAPPRAGHAPRAEPAPGGPRRIEPRPPAPPPAPAGTLPADPERPIGIRRARRPVVRPPGSMPSLRPRRRSVGARVAGAIALATLAIVAFGTLMLFQPFGSAEGSEVRVEIPDGASAREIGDRLADAGVVDSGLLFSIRAMLSGKRDSLRSGEHALRENMSYGRAIAALSAVPETKAPPTVKVTIPEGRTRREIVPIADKAGLKGSYLEASRRFAGVLNPFDYGAPRGTRSLEGFLFPATYELPAGAPARELVERQLRTFEENFAGVDLRRAERRKLTGYDVLIIASMVEREAKLARERPLVAAVIYNRLKDGMPLGIDATIRYALNKPSGALRQSELQSDSEYNTRRRAGLPPTPIGNPGLDSIRAAARPADVDYRYFVVKPGTCGEHAFSRSIEQFQRDSARYAQARERAGQRSPTTC